MKIIETDIEWLQALQNRSVTDYIALHHAEASSCTVYDVDRWHKSNGWSGIGYHFFVRKNGEVYRGRPQDKIGAHVQGMNLRSIGICAEGNYMKETMSLVQKRAICELLVYLTDNFYPNAKILGHKELGNTNCPGNNFPLDDIKENYRNYLETIEEYTDINDIIWELSYRKILSDSDLWIRRGREDSNIYWFLRKLCHYVRTKKKGETADTVYTDIGDIVWDLNYRGIISDTAIWEKYMREDINVYYLLQKGLHYVRTY